MTRNRVLWMAPTAIALSLAIAPKPARAIEGHAIGGDCYCTALCANRLPGPGDTPRHIRYDRGQKCDAATCGCPAAGQAAGGQDSGGQPGAPSAAAREYAEVPEHEGGPSKYAPENASDPTIYLLNPVQAPSAPKQEEKGTVLQNSPLLKALGAPQGKTPGGANPRNIRSRRPQKSPGPTFTGKWQSAHPYTATQANPPPQQTTDAGTPQLIGPGTVPQGQALGGYQGYAGQGAPDKMPGPNKLKDFKSITPAKPGSDAASSADSASNAAKAPPIDKFSPKQVTAVVETFDTLLKTFAGTSGSKSSGGAAAGGSGARPAAGAAAAPGAAPAGGSALAELGGEPSTDIPPEEASAEGLILGSDKKEGPETQILPKKEETADQFFERFEKTGMEGRTSEAEYQSMIRNIWTNNAMHGQSQELD